MEIRRELKVDIKYGDRLNVEIETPLGMVKIELRSGTFVYASHYNLNSQRMPVSLPNDDRMFICGWRMVLKDGEWIDRVSDTINSNFITALHTVRNQDTKCAFSLNGKTYWYEENLEKYFKEFQTIDAIVRPCIIQWLNEHPQELQEQEQRSRVASLKQAEHDFQMATYNLNYAKERFREAQDKLQEAKERMTE